MPRSDSTLLSLAVAAVMAAGVVFAVDGNVPGGGRAGDLAGRLGLTSNVMAAGDELRPAAVSAAMTWAASAPGKVEPREGELKISSQRHGRIVEVLVKLNDSMRAGDLLIRLDDDEARARVRAAGALADARKRTRDDDSVNRLATKRRKADDAVYKARGALHDAREDLDREAEQISGGLGSREALGLARARVVDARQILADARARLRKARAARRVPLETVNESALSAARAEVALAQVALERTRIRAPVDGTIMELDAKVGETVVPSPQSVLLRMGDLSALRVRAEVEERDVGKVRLGQGVVVRSKAFPGHDIAGTVSSLAPRLGPNRIAAKGPRRPTDLDVLEAMIELDGMPPLIPGMRVDVFFKPVAAASRKPVEKATN